MNAYVKSLTDLKRWCSRVFNEDSLEFSDMGDDMTMFSVHGKAKAVQASMLPHTRTDGWEDLEGGQWAFRDDAQNVFVMLRSIPRATMVIASVISLQKARMEKHQREFLALNPPGRT